MRKAVMRVSLLGGVAWLLTPAALWAHPGHPWLEGAAQPMLGLDHFLAALFVVVAVTLGLMQVARLRSEGEADTKR
jgi:hydrogenase/urease accessory protein HupE